MDYSSEWERIHLAQAAGVSMELSVKDLEDRLRRRARHGDRRKKNESDLPDRRSQDELLLGARRMSDKSFHSLCQH